jgi:putative endonuclease
MIQVVSGDCVYVLRSAKDGRLYTGVTSNLGRRLSEHNSGKVRSTASRRPLVLVYCERFECKEDARARERYFKTPEGGKLKQRLVNELDSLNS